jgi:hypothetical protein
MSTSTAPRAMAAFVSTAVTRRRHRRECSSSRSMPVASGAVGSAPGAGTPDELICEKLYAPPARCQPLPAKIRMGTLTPPEPHLQSREPCTRRRRGEPRRSRQRLDGAQTTAPMVGPALAGVLISALGAANVLYVDAATFGVAAIAVGLFVPRRTPGSRPRSAACLRVSATSSGPGCSSSCASRC